MFEELEILDSLGMYKEADELFKIILSNNNFMLTQKQINPQRKIDRKLNSIEGQLDSITNSLDDNTSGTPTDDSIDVEPYMEGNIEKIKFNLNN